MCRLHNLAKQAYPTSTAQEREICEMHVNEQFILGQPKNLQFDLLKSGDNTLDQNIELAKSYESAYELSSGNRSINSKEEDAKEEKYITTEGSAEGKSHDTEVVSLNVLKTLLKEIERPYPVNTGASGPTPTSRSTPGSCFNCGQAGHLARNCDARQNYQSRFSSNIECYQCHRKGHIRRNCPEAMTSRNPQRATGFRPPCKRCNNLGHDASMCRTDIQKVCRACNKRGHLSDECRSSQGRYQGYRRTEPALREEDRSQIDTKNLVAPGTSGEHWG